MGSGDEVQMKKGVRGRQSQRRLGGIVIAERMLGVGAGKLTCQVFLFFFPLKKSLILKVQNDLF